MHAMSSRHPHHTFHNHSQHNAPSPPPSSPYHLYSNNADLLSPSLTHQQNRSPSPYASHLVTHHPSTRPHSPIFPSTQVSTSMPRTKSPIPPQPPPSSGRVHTRDVLPPAPSPTPRPPEDVVMTSTINFTRDTRDRPIINQYLIGHRLGTGQHGEVYKGYDMRRGNMVVAIKACRRKNPKEAKVEQLRQRNQAPIPRTTGGAGGGLLNARPRLVDQLQNTEKKVLREIAIMKKCKHGQIVQLYEVINDRLTNKILLVMEYMGGGEVKWRDDAGRPCLRVDQTRRICRDVVLGLLYLHHQGIIHRDIKPANLLWTADRKDVKITDFGVSHFSAAQRIDALKHNTAYREALQRRIRARKKREEESSGTAAPARKKSGGVWRGKVGGSATSSKEDVKGKGRVRDDLLPPPPSSSLNVSSPASDDEDAAAEKELLNELAGDVDPILLDDGGLSRQAGTPSFLAPEIIWEFGEKQTAALYNRVGLSIAKLKREEDGSSDKREREGGRGRVDFCRLGGADADMDKNAITSSLSTMLKTPGRPMHTDEESTPRVSDVAARNSLELPSDALSPPSGPSTGVTRTQSTIPDPDPSSFHDPNAILVAEGEGEEDLDLPPRPPITKAIDVWALGVTLYCLLFGRTPWGGITEFAMYQMIHTEDFKVDETMGYDRVPTGGRFHEPGDMSEGAIVISLLETLLEKECSKRITLEEVKRLPWITRDIPNPEEWVAETAPERLDPIQITTADEDVAMTSVKFRWKLDVTKPLRRFRTLWPASRRAAAARQQQQQQHHQQPPSPVQWHAGAGQHDVYNVELDEILQRSLHIESESEKSERAISFAASRVTASEVPGLTRMPSRSRRMVDAMERGVRKISRHGTPSISGGDTPRNMKRRTLPDLMIGTRGRSMSHSRDGSPSRPSSRTSGPATPRIASGGSRSNLTSPSTAGFTSDGETDILDSDDMRAIRISKPSCRSLRQDRKEWEKEHRQKASARASLSNIGKILSWRPKSSPRASLSDNSSKGSIGTGWMGFTARSPATSPASPAGGSGSGRESGPASTRASFATQRLTRRSADEFGSAARMGPISANGARPMSAMRAATPGTIETRSDSGPAIVSAGVATDCRGLALASADELTSAMRASSWGDVADEFRYDYGYGATALRGDVDYDADVISDYGFGSGSAYGDSIHGNGRSFAFESGDVDGYANDENDEIRLVGAGGILSHPVSGPSSPNSLSGVSVGASIGAVPQDGFSLQGAAHEVGTASPGPASAGVVVSSPGVALLQTAQLQDTAGRRRGASVGSRNTHHVPRVVSSPLAQSPMNVHDSPGFDELDLDQDVKIDLSRNSSAQGSINVSFERPSPDSESSGLDARREERIVVVGHGVTNLKVEDEVREREQEHEEAFADDDSSSSEDAPIEVKRRRPSEILARSRSCVRPDVPPPPESAPASTSVPRAGMDDNTEIC